jgi:hypothetical protein
MLAAMAGLSMAALLGAPAVSAQSAPSLSPAVRPFVRVDAPVIALVHVRVIDGTGAAPLEDQTVVIAEGKIQSIGPAGKAAIPDAQALDLPGYTVLPGFVAMHEHMFYPSGGGSLIYNEMGFSAPRLYLACGVTSARTTGSIEPYTDLNLKKWIDALPAPASPEAQTRPGRIYSRKRCSSSAIL